MTQTSTPNPNAAAAVDVIRPRRSFLGSVGLKLLGAWGARLGIIWVAFIALLAVFAPLLANSHPLLLKTTDAATGGAKLTSPLYNAMTPVDVVLLIAFALGVVLALLRKAPKGKAWVWLGIVAASYLFASLFLTMRELDSLGLSLSGAQDAYEAALADLGPEATDVKTKLAAVKSAGFERLQGWFMAVAVFGIMGALWALCMYNLRRNTVWLATLVGLTVVVGVFLSLPAMKVMPPETTNYVKYRQMQADGHIDWAVYAPIPYSPADTLSDLTIDQRFAAPGYHPTEAEIARDMRTKALSSYNVVEQEVQTGTTIASAYKSIARYRAEYEARPGARPGVVRSTTEQLDELAQTPQRSRLFLMGTTSEGQDLASRMIHAARIALAIGFVATGIAVSIGVFIGGLMGYFSGWVDLIGMRLVEIFSAIPVIFLLIAIVAFWGRDLYLMMVVLGLTGWVGYALFTRAEFLKLRQMDYVMAARASGTGLFPLLFKHMLPNGVTPVLVSASFGIAGMILTEATLSFIGLGLVNEPSWGQMLSNAQGIGGKFYWWLAMYPIVAIFLTVFAYNLVGEAMRDALDPRSHKSTD